MKEQLQPDPKKFGTPGHGYGPMLAITSGSCSLYGSDPDTTKVTIANNDKTFSKDYNCATKERAQALVDAVQNNCWIYDADGVVDQILLVGHADTSAGQLWGLLDAVPTIDASNPLKMTFKYKQSTGDSQNQTVVATLRDTNTFASPENLVALVQTLADGGWELYEMNLGLGHVFSASTGTVKDVSEAGWICIGVTL